MIRAFRKYRGMTPSEYRKQMEYTVKQREKKGKEREEAAGDHDIFQSLLQYACLLYTSPRLSRSAQFLCRAMQ